MGCFVSSNANKHEFRWHANLVRKPTPWVYGDHPVSEGELEDMRNEFWENIIRAGGRPDIWEALKAATDTRDLGTRTKIIQENDIILGNSDMSVCYDDCGIIYDLPLYVLSEPINMENRVLRLR